MKPKHNLLFAILLLFASIAPLAAQQSTARFMLWQPSARSVAMGGVGTAIVDNAFAVFYNPAGLSFKDINIVGSYVKPFPFIKGTIHSLTAVSVPFRQWGTLSVSANRFWKDNQPVTGESGPEILMIDENDTNFFKSTHWELKLTYAALISENISVGVNMSFLKINLTDLGSGSDQDMGKTHTALFGAGILLKNFLPAATWKPEIELQNALLKKYADNRRFAGFSAGISFLNAGPDIAFIDDAQKDKPPTVLLGGLAFYPVASPLFTLLLAADMEKHINESSALDYVHTGTEMRFLNLLSFRAGYFIDTSEPRTTYFAFGAGIHLKFVSFNVARHERSFLPTWHFDGTLSLEI